MKRKIFFSIVLVLLSVVYYTIGPVKKAPNEEMPVKAWEQNFRATRNPQLGYIPRQSVLEAFKATKQRRLKNDGIIEWESRGPFNVGGRTRAIMFDPNDSNKRKVWAGGVTGGLWFIDDITSAHERWQSVDDFWANLGVTSINYDPNDPKVFYVGTGEGWWPSGSTGNAGFGIMKSLDGGQTWENLTTSQKFLFINDLVVRNENGQSVLYVAVDKLTEEKSEAVADQGLYRSIDGGATFTQTLPKVNDENYSPADIEIGANNRIYVATKNNSGGSGGGTVLYSDDGISWEVKKLKDDGERVEIACAPSNENYIYALVSKGALANGCYAMFSDNMGVTWEEGTHPDDNFSSFQAEYDLALCVHPTDHMKVCGGAVNVIVSRNGMSSWEDLYEMHADHHVIKYFPDDNTKMLFGNDGGVYQFNNMWSGSRNDIMRNNAYNVTQFYACAIHPEAGKDYFLAGAQDNGTEIFDRKGMDVTEGATGGDGCFCFISESNPKYQITAHIGNSFYRSTDGGNYFYPLDGVASGKFVNPADYDDNMGVLYSCGGYWSEKTIHRFKNIKGDNVTADEFIVNYSGEAGIGVSHIKVSPHTKESSTLFIGTEIGELLKVEDANTDSPSQTNLTYSGFPKNANISCIEIGNSENELIVCFSNYGVSSIWYTDDGGQTWSEKEGNLPDMPVRWLLQKPDERNKMLLASQFGIWYTENFFDETPDWQPENGGLANVRVDMLRIRKSDQAVIAATHGRGLFSTNAWLKSTTSATETENDLVSGYSIYPNPVDDILYISGNKSINTIALLNISGIKIKEYQVKNFGKKSTLNLSNVSPGLYFLKIDTKNKTYTEKIFIK